MNLKQIGLLLTSGALLSVSILVPPVNFLIWFAFVPLLILISEMNLIQSLLAGLFCGTAFFASLLYWIIQYEIRILAIVLALTIPFIGLVACLIRWVWNHHRHELIRILSVPAAWFLVHLIYSFTPAGIIGNQIAFLQAPHFPGIVRITGLSGITFLVLLMNSLIAHFLILPSLRGMIVGANPCVRPRGQTRGSAPTIDNNTGLAITTALVIISLLIFGSTSKFHFYQTRPLSVALVQHNFPVDSNWRASNRGKIMEAYQQTIKQLGGTVDLIAFPQYGLPVDALREPELLNQLASRYGTSIILGTYLPKAAGGSLESGPRTDSALLFSPGRPVQEYQAVTAPPFRQIGQVLGDQRKTLAIKHTASPALGEDKDVGVKAGILLCYENVVSQEGRRWVLNGAQILVSLSNPGHFLGTLLPFYHLTHDRIRAIETGKYLIRVSPNGFSAMINPNGELIKVSRLNEETVLKGVIYPNDRETYFVRWGDLIPNTFAALGILLILMPYPLASINFFARKRR